MLTFHDFGERDVYCLTCGYRPRVSEPVPASTRRAPDLTIAQAAEVAGVTRATVYRAIRRGELASVTGHRGRLVRRADAQAWVAWRRQPALAHGTIGEDAAS